MHHEMLPFCHHAQYKKGTLSQHFVMHVVPPKVNTGSILNSHCGIF